MCDFVALTHRCKLISFLYLIFAVLLQKSTLGAIYHTQHHITWCHPSRDHWTPHVWFPIGGPLQPYAYLAPLWRYGSSNILGSRPWPFGVTWRHRSRDHSTPHMGFPIGGQWWPCIYLAPLVRYTASKILGSRPWPFWITWRHRSRDHSTPHMEFPIGEWSMVTRRLPCTVSEI